mgnify:FL=1|jgi:hypothetical protein
MKKAILFILVSLLLVSCSDRKEFELEILNDKLVTYDKLSEKDTVNLIRYKLTNTTDKCYYINTSTCDYGSMCMTNEDNILFYRIYNLKTKEECKYGVVIHDRIEKFMNYETVKDLKEAEDCKIRNCKGLHTDFKKGFFINPKESLYFETYSKIAEKNDNVLENVVMTASIEKKVNYYADFFIPCDSAKIKKYLSWEDLQNIKEKKAIIYKGIIKTNKKIPIEVLD